MYFDGRGRGELIRIILAYSGEEWEDVRFNWPSKEWDEQKKSEKHIISHLKKRFSRSARRSWTRYLMVALTSFKTWEELLRFQAQNLAFNTK